MQIKELDVVRLKDGREGTVLEVFDDACMVEISDSSGKTLDIPIIRFNDIEKITYSA